MKSILLFACLLFSFVSNADERLSLSGKSMEGGLLYGKTRADAEVYYQDKRIQVSPQGDFIIGFHRDEGKSASLKVKLKDGTQLSRNITIKQRDYKIERINGLPKSKVAAPRSPELIKRINDEIQLAKKARARSDERLDYLTDFIWPVQGRISGVYGSQRILNGKARRPHYGVDIAQPTGTKVVAPAAGIITMAHKDMFYSGGTLILDHGHGLSSSFLHLSKILVQEGDVVKQGDVIAEVGATGRVTGAHLDWRMNWLDKRIDPQLLVPDMPKLGTAEKH